MNDLRNPNFVAPRLPTRVGFRGATTRQEVGGPVCLGIIVGIWIA
jgi:hypothetical protein